MTELFIEEQAMDLASDTVVAITKQVNDIGDLQNRLFDRTNSFVVPFSINNDKVMENADVIVSSTLRTYRKLKARIRVDGFDMVRSGFALLDGVDKQGYRITVYSGLLDFFDVLGEKTLQDLVGLNTFDHIFNLTNVVASQTKTTGFIYAVADYGNLPDVTRTIDIQQQGPSIFLQQVINQIFAESFFTKSGDIFTDQQYLDLIIPFTAEEFFLQTDLKFQVNPDGDQVFSTYPTDIDWEVEVFDDGDNFADPSYTLPRASTMTFESQGLITLPGVTDVTIEMRSSVAGTLDSQLITAPATDQAWTLTSGSISVASGEVINLRVTSGGTPTTTMKGDFFWNIIPTAGFEREITMREMMPKMKQTDLIKAVLNIFGLVIIFDIDKPRDVGFKKFQDLYTTSSEVDWSKKLDLAPGFEIDFGNSDYAQNNHLVWLADAENVEHLGRGTFTIDDDKLEGDKDVIKLPFACSDQIVKLGGVNCAKITRYTDPESSGNWTITESIKPRLCIKVDQGRLGGTTFTFDDGTATDTKDTIAVARVFNGGDDDELDGVTLLAQHYPGLTGSLARFKKVTASFILSSEDVFNLDHFVPVSVEHFGSRFFIIRVNNYISGESTKVELMKL